MNSNVGIQNSGLIAWSGSTAVARDISNHVRFGWVFEVKVALEEDVVFTVKGHPRSDVDPCLPGTAFDVEEIPTCEGPMSTDGKARFVIPAGTPAGSVCAGTIPCHPAPFVSIALESGTGTSVDVVLVRQGPVRS